MTFEERQKQLQLERIARRREEKRRRRIRHRITAVVTSAAVMTASLGIAYTASAKEVTITEINEFSGVNETIVLKTRVDNVGEVLSEKGVVIGDADKLNVSPETELAEENQIVITRGKQITIKSGGAEEVVNITKADTADALAEAGYTPGEKDEITANADNLAAADTISIVAVEEKEEETVTPIDFEVEYTSDSSVPKGESRVVTEGVPGERTTIYKVTYHDGIETGREIISEDITKEPVNKVIAKGTKEPVKTASAAGAGSSTALSKDTGNTINGMKYKKKITMQATAYSTSPSENGGYSVTAMGTSLRHGIVAVDPSVIPLGSKVYVESIDGSWSYGIASAEDTGGAIKGNKIDLCYDGTGFSPKNFGRRSCNVYILE